MKKLPVLLIALVLVALLACPALAEDSSQKIDGVTVKSTKVDRDLSQVTDSVSIITEEDFKVGNFTDITEAVRFEPSVQFKRAGGPGQYAYPKLRGFGNGHFLVTVDGMKINDGYSAGVGNFFAQIDPYLIEGAEIMRGPQSVLYGSDTTAGVFAFTTKGGTPGANVNIGAEYGSLDWKKGYAGFRGIQDDFRYSVNIAGIDSDGVHDHEFYENLSPQVKLGYNWNDKLDVEFSYLYSKAKFGYAELKENYAKVSNKSDAWHYQLPDPNQWSKTEYQLATFKAQHNINAEWRQKLTLGWYNKDNETLDQNDGLLGYISAPTDNFTLDWMNYYNQGQAVPVYDSGNGVPANTRNTNYMVDYNVVWEKGFEGGGNQLLGGVEYYDQDGKSWGRYGDTEGSMKTWSFYANDQLSLLDDALILNAGLRYNNSDDFDDKLVGKAGAAYTFPFQTTLFVNGGTTYRAPSVFQLYNARYGNKDLKPEEGWTVEAGVRQDLLAEKLHFDVTFWYTELDNLIDYESTGWMSGQYKNADEAKSQGVEFSLRYQVIENLTLLATYTYTDSESYDDGKWSRTVQIARNTATAGVVYRAFDRLDLGVYVYYSGPRLRWNGDVEMDEYTRVDLSATCLIWEGFSVYGRIQNLFDTDIEEGMGYEEPGFYGTIGLKWDFNFMSGK